MLGIYQWIRLNMLYEIMESFFIFWNPFLRYFKFFNKIIVALGLCILGGGGICSDQHAF